MRIFQSRADAKAFKIVAIASAVGVGLYLWSREIAKPANNIEALQRERDARESKTPGILLLEKAIN